MQKKVFNKKNHSKRNLKIKSIIRKEQGSPEHTSVTVNDIVTQPKFIEIVFKLLDSKLNYRDNTVWDISIIIILMLLGIFILNTYPSEAKTLKYHINFKQNTGKVISKCYTGLIIKVKRKNNFHSSMSPKIISENGKSIFCNASNFSHEQFNYLIREGIATFTDSIYKAKHRSGDKPLLVEAISGNNDTVVISRQSAEQIISENNKSNFLGKFKVSFLIY